MRRMSECVGQCGVWPTSTGAASTVDAFKQTLDDGTNFFGCADCEDISRMSSEAIRMDRCKRERDSLLRGNTG